MKNTKKIITLALAAAMLTATGITAFAADPTTDVTYEVAPVYTVVIPESVTLGDTAVTETIKIYGADENSNVVIGKKQKVNVALTASANDFKVKTADGDEVAYTVNDKNAVADLTTVAECTAADGKKNTTLTFAKTGTAAYAGTYTDTLTFTVSLADAAQTIDPETIIAQAGVSTYTGDNVKITVTSPGANSNPFYLSYYNGAPKHTATIEALNGAKIDKIEVTRGFYDISTLVAEKGDISITGTVATVSNINDTSVVIGSTNRLEVSQVKVYFK